MQHPASGAVIGQIESLFDGGSVAGYSDRQLLERFAAHRDAASEAAFAALVTRHGPMVLNICRQIVGDRHLAEDAFQAVFLVLARKAHAIRYPDFLSNWLHGVALRAARNAKSRLARQQKREAGALMRHSASFSNATVEFLVQPAEETTLNGEDVEALHDEIARLPAPFRLPVVLCYFEGLTLEEAAHRLQWRSGTLRSRLARARDKLRRGLTRRGVTLSNTALATALSHRSASAGVLTPLYSATTRAAIHFTTGRIIHVPVSATATVLANEILRSLLLSKLRFTLLILLALGTGATGAGYLSHSLAMIKQGPEKPATPEQARNIPQANPHAITKPEPLNQDTARMMITGHVLDPRGEPVPDAVVMAYAQLKQAGRPTQFASWSCSVTGRARCDGSGQFRIDAPRTSSSRHDLAGVTAIAPGYAVGWFELDPDTGQPTTNIRLRPEHVIHGRLFDLHGRPVRGVQIMVWGIILHPQDPPWASPLRFEMTPALDLPAWPKPATSDAEGRFTLHGLGQGLWFNLVVNDPRFASQIITIGTEGAVEPTRFGAQRVAVKVNGNSASTPLTIALQPARILTGRVTYADTGRPVANALVQTNSAAYAPEVRTDAQGKFRVNCSSIDQLAVTVYPPEREPYLLKFKSLDWPKGAVEQSLDLALPRGVLIHGRVTETALNTPVSGAVLRYWPYESPNTTPNTSAPSTTMQDGSFQLAVDPAPGYLSVQGPSDDYVLREISERLVREAQPGGSRLYAHAYVFLDLKANSKPQEVNVTLQRGMTVKGHVVNPDGEPVQNASIFSRVIMESRFGAWKIWGWQNSGSVKSGHFELHGLDPDIKVSAFFLDGENKLGATINFTGKSAALGPMTIRLEPCGSAKARLVDPHGQPISSRFPLSAIRMIVTPGPSFSVVREKSGQLCADEAMLPRIDPVNYPNTSVADAQGWITLPVLIPGATYRFNDYTTVRDPDGAKMRLEFTVRAGQVLDLGNVLIEKPSRR